MLTHLVTCGYCGSVMAFSDRGRSTPTSKAKQYLICDNGRRQVCDPETGNLLCARHRIRYEEVERLVIENCRRLRPEQVLPTPDEQQVVVNRLRLRLSGIEAELRKISRQIDNLVDQIADSADRDMRSRYEAKARQLRERYAEMLAKHTDRARQLAQAEKGLRDFTRWKSDMEELHKALDGGDVETRLRLRAHLGELIDHIEVFAAGRPRRLGDDGEWRDGEDVETLAAEIADVALPTAARSPRFREFLCDVTRRRMSKEGRFIRVHFQTGSHLNLVPDGSLADGLRLMRDTPEAVVSFALVSPDVLQLWDDWIARRGKGRKGLNRA